MVKKYLKDIIITFIIIGIFCAVFYKIGWINNSIEILSLFLITVIVISISLVKEFILKKKSNDAKGEEK